MSKDLVNWNRGILRCVACMWVGPAKIIDDVPTCSKCGATVPPPAIFADFKPEIANDLKRGWEDAWRLPVYAVRDKDLPAPAPDILDLTRELQDMSMIIEKLHFEHGSVLVVKVPSLLPATQMKGIADHVQDIRARLRKVCGFDVPVVVMAHDFDIQKIPLAHVDRMIKQLQDIKARAEKK